MKISREKAKELCTKSQYGEATWWELLQLNVYVLLFKECADFSAKNQKLTSLCDKANLNSLSESEKESMKKDLENRL
ncbi:hypothetical protein [Flagellimonas sp.]|uniref:hypothetical protein n=1 Tax=Flagellimonas sp. TaxID=2058762 RepID=UPI003B52BBB5